MLLRNKMVIQGNFLFKYRGILPVLILVPALWLTYSRPLAVEQDCYNTLTRIFYALAVGGLLIRIYAVGHASPNTSGRNTSEGQIADSVNNTGLYSQCRHPLYIGNFFMWLGLAGLTFHVWFILFFIVSYFFYYERIILAEESFLEGKFSDAYTTLAKQVPAIIPKCSGWIKNKNPFSLKKVIRQEKTGILLLNGLFLLFNAIHETTWQGVWNNHTGWAQLFMVTVGYYVVVKVIEKTTALLQG
jgi:protein-S-isoprenylcysteine O-methyltransferase Ste14